MKLTFLLFIDFLHTSSFEDGVPFLRGVGMQEGAIIHIYSTEVNFILRDIIHSQPFSFFALLGTVFGELSKKICMIMMML